MANPSPEITFRVNLELLSSEDIGPSTNVRSEGILHPDMHQNSPDVGTIDKIGRKNYRSTYLPGNLAGENVVLKHGDEFTLYGQKALYVRDMYASGYAPADRAFLTIVE